MSDSVRETSTVADSAAPGLTLRQVLRGHTAPIGRIAWSPDGRLLASTSVDNSVRLWDAATGKLLHALYSHQDWVCTAEFDPSGEILVTGSYDRTIKVWDVRHGTLLRTLDGHGDRVFRVAWSPSGDVLGSGSADNVIRLWDTRTWKRDVGSNTADDGRTHRRCNRGEFLP